MRWLKALILTMVLATSAFAAEVQFVRVWPQWRNADAFDRIGEYFGRGENDGRETVVRTNPADRAGMYFLVRITSPSAVENAHFVLEIIRPDSPDAKRFTFPVTIPAKSHVFDLGLTGGDWPGGRDAHPVAWKLTLVDAANQPLGSEQSFLWAKPAK